MKPKINLKMLLAGVVGISILWATCWIAVFKFNSPVPQLLGPIADPNDRFVMLLVTLGVGGVGLINVVRFFWLLVSEESATNQPTV